jgi:hypothetical protein
MEFSIPWHTRRFRIRAGSPKSSATARIFVTHRKETAEFRGLGKRVHEESLVAAHPIEGVAGGKLRLVPFELGLALGLVPA